eukprot:5716845-Prymnesium_polylepis.1
MTRRTGGRRRASGEGPWGEWGSRVAPQRITPSRPHRKSCARRRRCLSTEGSAAPTKNRAAP